MLDEICSWHHGHRKLFRTSEPLRTELGPLKACKSRSCAAWILKAVGPDRDGGLPKFFTIGALQDFLFVLYPVCEKY